MMQIDLDGQSLELNDIRLVARNERSPRVALTQQATEAIRRSRSYVEERVRNGDVVYGVTTGFGRLAEIVISPEQQAELQANLIRSHAVGLGEPIPVHQVRAIMLLRINALARGFSGIRLEVVELLVEFLNRGVHPVVPTTGSVGASGDLAPLSHIALSLMGEGEVMHDGRRRPTADVLAELGIAPVVLMEKEGLALINGTQATTGLGILAFLRAMDAVEALEAAGAMSSEALLGTPEAFRVEVSDARPQPGQRQAAENLRRLLRNSEIRESHREGDPRVQDAYALRCMPQVHGAARQALDYVRNVLEVEANSATDNPLIFPDSEAIVSAGNFHAQVVSAALDFGCIALTDLAAISERRIERLLNPDLSQGLPAFLAANPGLESGLMIAQVTACDILSEMRVLSHPASVDSVSTSASQEDHISMGFASARKFTRCAILLQYVVAVELAAAAQGIETRRPLKGGVGVEAAWSAVRKVLAPLTGDRSLHGELEALREEIETGAFTLNTLDPEGMGKAF